MHLCNEPYYAITIEMKYCCLNNNRAALIIALAIGNEFCIKMIKTRTDYIVVGGYVLCRL